MGGEIGVDSVYGEGAHFYFTIPYKPSLKELRDSEGKLNGSEPADVDFSGKLVLIAEDERANFEFLKKVVERTGATIIHAKNGLEAVDICSSDDSVDVVLMDIMMPEMNGLEATGIIKGLRPGLPVVAQTALAMEGDAEKILRSGCDDYISKPIRINELITILDKHLHPDLSTKG